MKLVFAFCLAFIIAFASMVVPAEAKSVICYFTNWSWYRQGNGKYSPADIDPNLCSHVIYGFATLDPHSLLIQSYDPWVDIDNRFYEQVTDLRHRGVKVLLAIGGWNDSYDDKYNRLIRDPGARTRFIQHVIGFLQQYNFQGLDLDFEYPVCWQNDCSRGDSQEKEWFAQWVQELKNAFTPRGLLVSAAVSASKKNIDLGYDVPKLAQYLDFLNLMTYDYHGSWDGRTGHVSPLRFVPESGADPTYNTEWGVNYWIQQGFPREKIMMGIPLYGQSFTLQSPRNSGVGSPSYGGGQAGEYTGTNGFLAYYEICDRVNTRGWHTHQDGEFRMGPYSWQGDQWVGYDDREMITRKTQFINRMGLGGGMIWALDLDDFRGTCGYGNYPLLSTIRRQI